MWFGEPHPFSERGSPTGMSASGQQSYEGWSCRVMLPKLQKCYTVSCFKLEVIFFSPLQVSLALHEDARYNVSSYDSMLADWLVFLNIFCQLMSNWFENRRKYQVPFITRDIFIVCCVATCLTSSQINHVLLA